MALSSYEFPVAYSNFLCFRVWSHLGVTLSWVHAEPWGGARGFTRWPFNPQDFGDLFPPLPPCTSEAFSSFNGLNLSSAHFQVFRFWISSWDTLGHVFLLPHDQALRRGGPPGQARGPARHSSSGLEVASRRLAWKMQKSLCHCHSFPSLTPVPTHIPNSATGREGQIPLEKLLERKVEGALLRSQNLLLGSTGALTASKEPRYCPRTRCVDPGQVGMQRFLGVVNKP